MAYSLPETSSIEAMMDYTIGVAAGLAVEDLGTAELAPPWEALYTTLRTARDTRDDKRNTLLRAAAVVRVRDVRWDGTIGQLSSDAYHAAGKQADQPPYAPLFGGMKADEAKDLGPAKAIVFGSTLAKKLTALDHPALAGRAEQVTAANQALEAAATARRSAYEDTLLEAIARTRLLDALHLLIAQTEAALLTKFPGNRDLVRSLLSPSGVGGAVKPPVE